MSERGLVLARVRPRQIVAVEKIVTQNVSTKSGQKTKSRQDTAAIPNLVQDKFERACGYRPGLKTERLTKVASCVRFVWEVFLVCADSYSILFGTSLLGGY